MSRPLTFERWIEGDIHTYRFVARGDEPIVEKNWAGLYEEWPDNSPTPATEFAVNNNNCEEVAVYLGLIWRLAGGRTLYGVPRWHRDAGMSRGAPYALIDWEYHVENEESADIGTIKGFVPARSGVRGWPPPGPWERDHANKAGFFEIPVFEALRDVVLGLLSDARAELNLYALSSAEEEELRAVHPLLRADSWEALQEVIDSEPVMLAGVGQVIGRLQGSDPPTLGSLLGPGELLISFCLGIDMGYADVIVVHSKTDLSEELDELTAEYDAAIATYEREVDQIGSMPEFLDRLWKLVNLAGPV